MATEKMNSTMTTFLVVFVLCLVETAHEARATCETQTFNYAPPTAASDSFQGIWEFTSQQLDGIAESNLLSLCTDDVVAFSTPEYLPPHACQILEEQISRAGSSLLAMPDADPELIRRSEDEVCVKQLVSRVVQLQKGSCTNPVSYKIADEGFGMIFRDMIQAMYLSVRHSRTVLWSGEFWYGGCRSRNLSCVFQRNSGCNFYCPSGDLTCNGHAQSFAEAKFGEADAWLTDPDFAACFTGAPAPAATFLPFASIYSSVLKDWPCDYLRALR